MAAHSPIMREVVSDPTYLPDPDTTEYLNKLGYQLVAASNARHMDFTFFAVKDPMINAFALPGGPMFVNRGMIEAANSEGEVVGVMAHELSHVLLRHGTAQASKAGKYQVGQVAGALLPLPADRALPDLPAISEMYSGFGAVGWNAMLAPAGTPREIVDRLSQEVQKAVRDPAMITRFEQMAVDAVGSTQQELADTLRQDYRVYGEVVKAAGLSGG